MKSDKPGNVNSFLYFPHRIPCVRRAAYVTKHCILGKIDVSIAKQNKLNKSAITWQP